MNTTTTKIAGEAAMTDAEIKQIDSALDMLMCAMRAANWEGDSAYVAGKNARALLASGAPAQSDDACDGTCDVEWIDGCSRQNHICPNDTPAQSCGEPTRHTFAFAALDEAAKICDAVAERFSEEPRTQYAADLAAQEIRILSAQWQEVASAQPVEQTASRGNDALFASVTDWVNTHRIPFEAQNELFRILAASATWEALFDRVALELNCLPSSSVDGNEHVFQAIAKLRAALTQSTATQPAQTQVALTPDQIDAIYEASLARWDARNRCAPNLWHEFARAILTAQPVSGGKS